MVGAARRLATELVVIIARATHEIHAVAGTLARAAAAPVAASAALMSTNRGPCGGFETRTRSSPLTNARQMVFSS
jgi:hypothetical protein